MVSGLPMLIVAADMVFGNMIIPRNFLVVQGLIRLQPGDEVYCGQTCLSFEASRE